MSNKLMKTFRLVLISTFTVCLIGLKSNAVENTLSAVEIKNSDSGYQILLRSDKASEVRKTTESSDDVILELRGILPVESVATIYNNVPEIDNVIIEPLNNSNTRVIIHGKNVAGANISFKPVENIASQNGSNETLTTNSENEIELSKPIQNYSPVVHKINEFQDQEPSGMISSALFLAKDSAISAKPILSKIIRRVLMVDRKILALGGLFSLIILIGLVVMGSDNKNEIKVGLSQSLKDREIDINDNLALSKEIKTLRSQKQSISQSTPSINYGIKAYQTSQRNPYTSQVSGIAPRKPITNRQPAPTQQINTQSQNQAELQRKLQQVRSQQTNIQKPQVQKTQLQKNMTQPSTLGSVSPISASVLQAAQSNIQQGQNVDSMKFLESMTKIYERSGRADLANELKASIQKVKVAG